MRVTTRLIQLNVVAQDRHGNPVTDLTKDDFVLKDAGKEQKISVFSMERSDGTPASPVGGHVVAGQTLPPGTFTNRVERKVGAVTVILFDSLNTSLADSIRAKEQLVKYIKQMSPDDQVALYVLGRDLKLVHDFTRSPEALIKAVSGDKLNAINTVAADADPADSDTGNDDLDAAIDRANQMLSDYLNVHARTADAGIAAVDRAARLAHSGPQESGVDFGRFPVLHEPGHHEHRQPARQPRLQ